MTTTFQIDAREVERFGEAMAKAPGILRSELVTTTNTLLARGVGLAADFAPVEAGTLQGSIRILEPASLDGDGVSGSYGTDLIYAKQREFGGTIHGNPWLVFQINGQWVKVKSVTQKGSHYMSKSHRALWPVAQRAFSMAVDRTLEMIV